LQGTVLRFAGHELDPQRAELRRSNGEAIRLRPKSFDMLLLFAANAGRVLSKQELIEAVWPNVHVSEDSLFQCIREVRTALGDDRRELIRLVSGRGYLFDAQVFDTKVSTEPAEVATGSEPAAAPAAEMESDPARAPLRSRLRGRAAIGAMVALGALIGLAAAAPLLAPNLIFARKSPTIAVMPIAALGDDPQLAEIAAGVTERLTNGLARIERIRVVAPPLMAASASPQAKPAGPADFTVSGELQKSAGTWQLQARMTSVATGEVRWTNSAAVGAGEGDLALQHSRLAAGLGHPLALRINALVNSASLMRGDSDASPAGNAKVVIEQASAIINQTTKERFRAAQAMLEKALAADPDNADLEIALASHLIRGVQTVWYDPADVTATENSAQAMLEHALHAKPDYVPALEAYCRFLAGTNHLSESLIACAKTLSLDPWDGIALFNLGLTQILQGRFAEALATFKQADEFDTPKFARWTWLLGAGLACALMERNEEAVSWLERSLAITPGTGRTQMLLAAVDEQLGRHEEAKAQLAKGMALRPGSNAQNFSLPTKNASPVFIAASERIIAIDVALGLPGHP
jgi:DNA-binding winged helix-turn-helix (wHTH) protein/tetratricopeptide (TPR) repeat protein/TolB-like protein